jgi:YD repeat-containing protein
MQKTANNFAVTYTYDPAGNRLVQWDRIARTTSTYDAANQLAVARAGTARTTYLYDAAATAPRRTSRPPPPTTPGTPAIDLPMPSRWPAG